MWKGVLDLEKHFALYGAYHRNPVNILIHTISVWLIFFNSLVLFHFIPPLLHIPFVCGFDFNFAFASVILYALLFVVLDKKAGSLGAVLCLLCWFGSQALTSCLGFSLAWKATGKDKEIYRGKLLVGMKKTLVFYRGRAPRGEKSNWVMHEYRLEGKYSIYTIPKAAKNEWVLCRVFKKSLVNEKKTTGTAKMVSFFGENTEPVLPPPALPPLTDIPHHVTCFSNATEGQKAQEPELLSASAAALQYLINPPFQFASANNPSVDLSPLFFSKFMPMAASHHPGGFVHLKQGYYLETEALDTRLSSDMNPDVTSEIEIGRSSFEHCSWNC
ncbi:hypothetical protein HPP92_002093 [Vanilla planifolia]|uniref:NAC domain-containing protein n=1 Tax=Vanilla planifolia TaxID=51239 RepID=A0A835S921_VANPL|nr:hypothetical protein HPP92_002093 [Vanilla planifolia]